MMITVIVPRTGGYDKERRIQVEADEVRVVREAADPRWISVKEKLPEYAMSVLAYARCFVRGKVYIESTYIATFIPPRKSWDHIPDGYEVTHWMLLPEPPKEEEE